VPKPEDRKERLDRELIELLNELRVALPGVQVLFAFLLTVPFTERFTRLTEGQRDGYFAAFIATAISSILLMAPSAYHRLRWRQADKEHMLRLSNALAIAGIGSLAIAISLVVFVVTDLVFFSEAAAVATAIVGGGLVLFWFAIPLRRRLAEGDGSGR
jgi:cation transport ATPase